MNDETRSPGEGMGSRRDARRRDYVPGESMDEMSEDLSRLLVEGFEPSEPDPTVWVRIASTISAGETPSREDIDELESDGVVSLDERRRTMWPAMFAVAAVFLAALGTVFVLNAGPTGDTVAGPEVTHELVDPDTGDTAMTVTIGVDGEAYATATDLTVLTDDLTYQLWSVVGDEVVSVGLLGTDPDEVPLRIEGDPAVLALTVERAGGVAVSEATPVAVWQATG